MCVVLYNEPPHIISEFMRGTDCACFSAEVFLQERFPASLIHQVSNRVIEEGSVSQDLLPLIGQSHRQIGFLSGETGEEREPKGSC